MKVRLDQIMLDLELTDNRSKARGLIVDGHVIVNNDKITKPGTLFDPSKIKITITKKENLFVSRAGDKLFKAINNWKLNLNNLVCLDIGSSTGGFTQCCLEKGAAKVFAVDVGTNQLDWKLRSDERVISMEKTNFRYVTKDKFDSQINFYCCDVSFISLNKILPALSSIVENKSFGVMLIKPQFESEKEEVKNGKVNDPEIHKKDIIKVFDYCIENNFSINELDFSPILGNKKKNIEYLILIEKSDSPLKNINESQIDKVIDDAWKYFKGDINE